MTYNLNIPVLALILSLLALLPFQQAQAQFPFHDNAGTAYFYDEEGEPYSSKYWPGKSYRNVVSLVRKPELMEDQFVLRITHDFTVHGCIDFSDYAYEAKFTGHTLDVTIDNLKIDMRDKSFAPHYDCDQSGKSPAVDIILSRQDLIEKELEKVKISNGITTNTFDIELFEDHVTMLPSAEDLAFTRTYKPQTVPGRKTTLSYWFYPVGTVLLWVPGSKDDNKVRSHLINFAAENGLVPLETFMPEFKSPLKDPAYLYFVDTAGKVTSDPDIVDGKPIGHISVDTLIYELEGDIPGTKDLAVYAKLPGMYE